MTPRDLLGLADELSDDEREAAWRAAAHCAYYAAFHAARELFRSVGFVVPDADRAHAYVWQRLQNCGHPEVTSAGFELREARRLRNVADYDINVPFRQKDATAQVARAARVVQVLDQLAALPDALSRVTEAVRAYERDVLREPTWAGPA